jgi:hypothetical protein
MHSTTTFRRISGTCLSAALQEMCFHALPVAESFFEPFRHHTLVEIEGKRVLSVESTTIAITNGSSDKCAIFS